MKKKSEKSTNKLKFEADFLANKILKQIKHSESNYFSVKLSDCIQYLELKTNKEIQIYQLELGKIKSKYALASFAILQNTNSIKIILNKSAIIPEFQNRFIIAAAIGIIEVLGDNLNNKIITLPLFSSININNIVSLTDFLILFSLFLLVPKSKYLALRKSKLTYKDFQVPDGLFNLAKDIYREEA